MLPLNKLWPQRRRSSSDSAAAKPFKAPVRAGREGAPAVPSSAVASVSAVAPSQGTGVAGKRRGECGGAEQGATKRPRVEGPTQRTVRNLREYFVRTAPANATAPADSAPGERQEGTIAVRIGDGAARDVGETAGLSSSLRYDVSSHSPCVIEDDPCERGGADAPGDGGVLCYAPESPAATRALTTGIMYGAVNESIVTDSAFDSKTPRVLFPLHADSLPSPPTLGADFRASAVFGSPAPVDESMDASRVENGAGSPCVIEETPAAGDHVLERGLRSDAVFDVALSRPALDAAANRAHSSPSAVASPGSPFDIPAYSPRFERQLALVMDGVTPDVSGAMSVLSENLREGCGDVGRPEAAGERGLSDSFGSADCDDVFFDLDTDAFAQHADGSFTVPSYALDLSEDESFWKNRKRLEDLGLPPAVLDAYRTRGIRSLYEWQEEALATAGVLEGSRNLVYSAPTSAGKTMVAELLALVRCLESESSGASRRKRKRRTRDPRLASALFRGRRRALIVLPFVSIVVEKARHLSALFGAAGLEVAAFYGGKGAGLDGLWDVGVCTIEKANGLLNRMLEEYGPEGLADELCCVVIDELHTLGDTSRGYLLEMILTKVLASHARSSGDPHGAPPPQIVAMSATLPNLDEFARWLHAELFVTDFRPVRLDEYILREGELLSVTANGVDRSDVVKTYEGVRTAADGVLALCSESVAGGHSVLVFCFSRVGCGTTAKDLAKRGEWDCTGWTVRRSVGAAAGAPGSAYLDRGEESTWTRARDALLDRLRRSPAGLDDVLGETLKKGVAFHHAGLTTEEREEVEDAFSRGIVRVLVATTTLASGVNLPARRVIFNSYSTLLSDNKPDRMRYSQMSGRAGRKGLDTSGESVVVVDERNFDSAVKLLVASPSNVKSALVNTALLERVLLEAIVNKFVASTDDVAAYVGLTLRAHQGGKTGALPQVLASLEKNGFVSIADGSGAGGKGEVRATRLGAAAIASSLSTEEAAILLTELERAQESYLLKGELFTIFQLTPVRGLLNVDVEQWAHYFALFNRLADLDRTEDVLGLSPSEVRGAAEALKLPVGVLFTLGHNDVAKTDPNRIRWSRFFAALILYAMVTEKPLCRVAETFCQSRDVVQSLQQRAATHAGMVTAFCERLGWENLRGLFESYQQRFDSGVAAQLCDLVRIPPPEMTRPRARTLFDAGLKSVAHVANAGEKAVGTVLVAALPFQAEAHVISAERAVAARLVAHARSILEHEKREQEHATDVLMRRLGAGESSAHSAEEDVGGDCPAEYVQALERVECSTADAWGELEREWLAAEECAVALSRDRQTLAVTWGDAQRAYLVPLCAPDRDARPAQVCAPAAALLGAAFGRSATVVAFRCKSLVVNLERMGVRVSRQIVLRDPLVSAWILNHVPDTKDASLNTLTMAVLGTWIDADDLCRAASVVLRLERLLAVGLEKLSPALAQTYVDVEMPAMHLAARVQLAGIAFDSAMWTACQRAAVTALSALRNECQRLAGKPFRLESHDEVARVLYVDLGLNPEAALECQSDSPGYANGSEGAVAHTASGPFASPKKLALSKRTGLPSTKRHVLEAMMRREGMHPIVAAIYEWRRLYKIVTRTLPAVFDGSGSPSSSANRGGRVHPHSDLTATGRMAAYSPGVQQVPSSFSITHPVAVSAVRDRLATAPPFESVSIVVDRETGKPAAVFNLRASFTAAGGHVLVSADYSQLELRVLAHLSCDKALQAILQRPGGDVFRLIAAKWLCQDPDGVTPEMRTHAKKICYGIVYGIGVDTLAGDMGVSVDAAKRHLVEFRSLFPRAMEFVKACVAKAREDGFTQTLLHRRRNLPNLHLREAEQRAHAERQAVNTAIQGSAADIVKCAITAVERRVAATGCRAVLVLQMHDELIYEVATGDVEAFAAVLREEMEAQTARLGLSVPLPVVVRTGPNWGRLSP